jgi:hypothetical protein
LDLAPGADARYDWMSGVVQLDATREEFENAFNLSSEIVERTDRGTVRLVATLDKARVHNALIHESLHFLQVVTNGYIYRWAVEYVVHATRGWLQLVGERHNEESVKLEALQGRIEATHAQRRFLLAHLGAFDRPGVSGITVRSLIESLAYYIQIRGQFGFTSAEFARALNDCPDLEYRVAYDAVRFVVGGEAAFDLFPILCNASLCTSDPVWAFTKLIFLDLKSIREDVRIGQFSKAWDALRHELGELWIGTAPQVRTANPLPAHPIISPAVDRLIEVDDTKHPQLLTSWFADPQFFRMESLSMQSHQTVMLRQAADGNFPIIPSPHASEAETDLIASALAISAIVRRVYGKDAEWTAKTSPLLPLRWLTRDAHTPLGLEVSLGELAAGDTSHVEELLRPVDGWFVEGESFELDSGQRLANIVSPNKKGQAGVSWHEMFLGRFTLAFPGDIAAESDSRQAFVAKLAARVPTTPAYLSFRDNGPAFAEWFGALCDLNDDNFVLVITDAIIAIGTVAKNNNLNAWLHARSVLGVYPQDYAELLLQHPLFENKSNA